MGDELQGPDANLLVGRARSEPTAIWGEGHAIDGVGSGIEYALDCPIRDGAELYLAFEAHSSPFPIRRERQPACASRLQLHDLEELQTR